MTKKENKQKGIYGNVDSFFGAIHISVNFTKEIKNGNKILGNGNT